MQEIYTHINSNYKNNTANIAEHFSKQMLQTKMFSCTFMPRTILFDNFHISYLIFYKDLRFTLVIH